MTLARRVITNFPFCEEAGVLDIDAPDGADDAAYLDALQRGIDRALSASQLELANYLAGADPYRDCRLFEEHS